MKTTAQGVNVTGLQETWEKNLSLRPKTYRKTFRSLNRNDIEAVRIPVDIEHFLTLDDPSRKRRFIRLLNKIIRYQKNDKPLILAYFNHNLAHDNFKSEAALMAKNWIKLLKSLNRRRFLRHDIYIEIANEPQIYPREWKQSAAIIIEGIRGYYPELPIIAGASNFNSIYELSRLEPFPYDNIIYSFHFYEPFIFTHQGTPWTAPQNNTLGIPFPYPLNNINLLPPLAKEAMGTPGEINYRDYGSTGTYDAIENKISIISNWRDQHDVEVWCTEYGVTKNADKQSRKNYLRGVHQTLKAHDIPGFIWEYQGNFGVKDLNVLFK
ncbi:cellulase family glycosylhydrolase [Psychroflexus sp. YR1-1]|uniref:Cellulase family glycosylhydrolase n=1 Tax=Psychroflexus aurantiacus TaxID=2709310 RepID=A0A6B3R1L2_9FLAO|nr:cellulase family glycosylhydrolase [Psychroflexus aurantiacus]NEV94526.1 cellulase family glycosylhydrolase [Psychroflexus aurantiacus]